MMGVLMVNKVFKFSTFQITRLASGFFMGPKTNHRTTYTIFLYTNLSTISIPPLIRRTSTKYLRLPQPPPPPRHCREKTYHYQTFNTRRTLLKKPPPL